MLRRALILLAVLPACAPAPTTLSLANMPDVGLRHTVRVGIAVNVSSITVACDGPMLAMDPDNVDRLHWDAGAKTFTVDQRGLVVVGERRHRELRVRSRDASKLLTCDGLTLRGDLIVRSRGHGRLTVIEELDIEDYLKGVLPVESNPGWPAEAIKAQAVTSRTFAASHLNRHRADGFDVCMTAHCQRYVGAGREDARTSAGAEKTAGQLLIYNGRPIDAYFGICCGGMSETPDQVWGGLPGRPYLVRKPCPYCRDADVFTWRARVPSPDILSALFDARLAGGSALQTLAVTERSPSGRAKRVRVTTDEGDGTVNGDAFRRALNGDVVRSTLFDVALTTAGAVFNGRGWGAGVGLCEWGARGQALQGRGYLDILEFYFPGTRMALWRKDRNKA